MFGEVARLAVDLSLQGNFTSGIGNAQRALGTFNQSVGRIGTGVGQVAGGLTRLGLIAGGVAAVGIGAAAKQAIAFEDAFAGVRKTIDESELTAAGLSFDALAKSFRGMATEIPIAATEFARIGEAAGALGVKATDIETFTRTVALLGVTTNLTSDQAAESLGKIGTILGLTGKDFTEFADALVDLGNKGASTETEIIEITKRFGAAGQAAGLSTDQILAFSSAIASAGVEPEAAGSSLSRLFGNLIKETALASDAGKSFADVAGKSFKDFSKIVETDTVGAMLLFLDSLKDLDKFSQEKALAAVGITNVRDRNAVRLLAESYDRNLIPALETAKTATGALSTEAEKRFDTIRSKIGLLKNNLIEAGIVVGEGFLPALGRSVEKLTKALSDPATQQSLRDIGISIGRFIDGIDWKGLADNARTAMDVIVTGVGTVSRILAPVPDQVKAIGAALLIAFNSPVLGGALKSITSGIGNIVAGVGGVLARGVAAKIPGVGALFAQPVYVVNMPLGGLGGLGGVAGKAPLAVSGFLAPGFLTALTAFAVPFLMLNVVPQLFRGAPGSKSATESTLFQGTINAPPTSELSRQILASVTPYFEAAASRLEQTPPEPTGTGGGRATVNSLEEERAFFRTSFRTFLDRTFGPHGEAAEAFGATELRQFRTDPTAAAMFLDERIRYLAGAQGSGTGSEQYLGVVSRDIAALKTLLPMASGAEADKIREGIDILSGVLAAKKFVVSPEAVKGARDPSRERTEAARATDLMATLPGAISGSSQKTAERLDMTRGSIEYARTVQASKQDATTAAIRSMQSAVVLAISGLDLRVTNVISAKDVNSAQGTVTTYDSPTTVNRKGGPESPW